MTQPIDDKNGLYHLYFLDKEEQKKVEEAFIAITGRKETTGPMDEEILQLLLSDARDKKMKRSTPEELKAYYEYLTK